MQIYSNNFNGNVIFTTNFTIICLSFSKGIFNYQNKQLSPFIRLKYFVICTKYEDDFSPKGGIEDFKL
jgi:hypothetical protein